jgi:hypothetical protein
MRWLWLLPPLVFSAAVYYPIGRNTFYSDDFLNLYHIANHALLEYLLTPNGGHVLVTRNAVFYLTAQLAGVEPMPYYWSAVVAHLVNVALLFGVIQRLTQSMRLACFGAALWGVSPLHEGTLGWYAVFGHALVGTTLLIIIFQAAGAAAAARPPSRAQRWLWYALALMAATSFGTGLGIAMALPFALHLLLPSTGRTHGLRHAPLRSLVLVVPVLYALILVAYAALSGTPAFGQTPLILLSKPIAILCELAELIALGLTRLVLGAYLPPWITPGVWYALLCGFALGLFAAFYRAAPAVRGRIAACALLLLGCYAAIAVGRGLLLSEISVDVFMALSRYHYVGQLLLAIILCLLLDEMAPAVPSRLRTAALVGWFAVAVFVHARFATAIDHHLEARRDTERVLAAVQSAAAAAPPAQAVYVTNRSFRALPLPMAMFPGWAAVFTIFHAGDTIDGRRIYFVEDDPAVLRAAQRGARTRSLIVPPASAAQAP